jgi:acetyl esterase/lipase
MTLAGQGALVFVFDYEPLVPDVALVNNGRGFRQYAEMTSCAVRFARAQAPAYNGDPQQVTWVRFSAGAYIGGLATFHSADQLALSENA